MNDIAVIMSVYKSDNPEYLVSALDSIINQTIECDFLIYQDGPIPNSLSTILSQYKNEHKNIVLIKNEVNQGLAVALNTLIDYAVEHNYEFIARMDSDDISYSNRLEKQVNYLKQHPDIDVLGTACKEFGASFAKEKKILPQNHSDILNYSITRCPFIHPSVMFSIDIFKKGYRYPTNTILTEDMAFWFELLKSGAIFENLSEILIEYRISTDTIRRRKGIKKAINEYMIRWKNMFILRKINIKNILLINSRIVFHILPESILKFIYRHLR